MKPYIASVALVTCLGQSVSAEELTTYQQRVVGEVVLDATEYCAYKAEEYKSPEAGKAIIEEGFVNELVSDEDNFVILDLGKLDCGVGDSGYCGSSGCSIWIISPTEQKHLLGKLVRIPEGYDDKGPRLVYCGEEDAWEDCVDIKDILK
jgi:hypothetical protein